MTTHCNDYQTNGALNFCDCTLNFETQTLQIKSEPVQLRNKLWSVLVELLKNSNKLVQRNNLIQDIWQGNRYTGEQGLTHAVCHLRRILAQYKIEAKIITLPKKGYILQYKSNQKPDSLSKVNASQIYTTVNYTNPTPDLFKIEMKYTFN